MEKNGVLISTLVDDELSIEMNDDPSILSTENEERRGEKRDREEISSDEGWITQGKGRKVIRSHIVQAETNDKTQVAVTSETALPKQFALARLFKDNKIRAVSRVKYVHAYKMLLSFDAEEFADLFINCQAFTALGWRSQKTSEVGLSYGVIKDIDMDLPEADIKSNLVSEEEIVSVKRLKKRNQDKSSKEAWVNSESVRLGFKGSRLPPYVAILGMKMKVEPYVFPVTQCSRCWKFGHNAIRCPAKKVVCPKCSKYHANCEIVQARYRCVNCTGNHMSLQRSCPVYKKERRIRELMSEYNCTYKQALSMYVPPSPASVCSLSPAAEFPPLHPHRSTDAQAAPQPASSTRLMSDLFKSIEQVPSSSSKTPTSRRKLRARTPVRPATPIHRATRDDCEDWYVPDNERAYHLPANNSEDESSKKNSFINLLRRLRNIIMSKDSLEAKIHQSVQAIIEWFISKIGNNFSPSSLMTMFMNVVMNEHG